MTAYSAYPTPPIGPTPVSTASVRPGLVTAIGVTSIVVASLSMLAVLFYGGFVLLVRVIKGYAANQAQSQIYRASSAGVVKADRVEGVPTPDELDQELAAETGRLSVRRDALADLLASMQELSSNQRTELQAMLGRHGDRFVPAGIFQAEALSAPDRQQAVDDPHTDIQWLRNRFALQRIERSSVQRHVRRAGQAAAAVDRLALAIKNASQNGITDGHFGAVPHRNDARHRLQPLHVAGRHQENALAGKADGFGFDRRAVRIDDAGTRTQSERTADCLKRQTDNATQLAFDAEVGRLHNLLGLLAQARAEALIGAGGKCIHRFSAASATRIASRRVSRRASSWVESVLIRQSPRCNPASATI